MGTLGWLIHSPFLRYAETLPDYSIEVSDGASRAQDGTFVFSLTVNRLNSGRHTTLDAKGRVAIRAYEGMLRVDLINPKLELERGAGRLFTESPYRAGDFVPIAKLLDTEGSGWAVPGSSRTSIAEAHLTTQGAGWLSEGRYSAGLPVAPVILAPQLAFTDGDDETLGARIRIGG